MRRFAPQLFAQLFCISLFVLAVSISQAQNPSRAIQDRVQNREAVLENLRSTVNVPKVVARHNDQARLQAQVELRNDFRNLQIANNQLMARVFESASIPNEKITHREIRSRLGEIRKLAERLRFNFGIQKLKAFEQSSGVALKPGLLQLDKAVMSFVENPFFQQPKVYDSELVSRAERDIGEVLRLTEALRKVIKEN